LWARSIFLFGNLIFVSKLTSKNCVASTLNICELIHQYEGCVDHRRWIHHSNLWILVCLSMSDTPWIRWLLWEQ
jgi:hypothetical protein